MKKIMFKKLLFMLIVFSGQAYTQNLGSGNSEHLSPEMRTHLQKFGNRWNSYLNDSKEMEGQIFSMIALLKHSLNQCWGQNKKMREQKQNFKKPLNRQRN